MKRGDIYFAELSPTRGSEIAKRRPVILVSNDANNRVARTVTVVPVTSNVSKVYPFEVFLPAGDSGLPKDTKAQAQQLQHSPKSAWLARVPANSPNPNLKYSTGRCVCILVFNR